MFRTETYARYYCISYKNEIKVRNNHQLTILKAIAITFVVMAHASSPLYISRLSYMLGVSLFFMASGFFFNVKYLNDEATFVKRRLKGLYIPFVKWSVLLLILHNLWFKIGILNESYGNAAGGVTHPLNARQWMQSLWSIVTNMSGYDVFLGGAYWFFRALLVSSIVFLILFKLLSLLPCYHVERADTPNMKDDAERFSPFTLIAITIACISLSQALWKTVCNLRWTGLAQGGYRELMGIFFLSVGYLYNRFYKWVVYRFPRHSLSLPKLESPIDGTPVTFPNRLRFYSTTAWVYTKKLARSMHRIPVLPILIPAVVTALFVAFPHPSMATRARNVSEVLALAASGIVGFAFVYNISAVVNRLLNVIPPREGCVEGRNMIARIVLYVGENTLYIFGWHILAFKLVSMVKVGVYGLPWEMVGGHPVVHSEEGTWFWILYSIVGIALPLCCVYLSGVLRRRYFPEYSYVTLFVQTGKAFSATAHGITVGATVAFDYICRGARWFSRMAVLTAHYLWIALCWTFGWFVRGIIGFWHSLIDAVKSGTDVDDEE